MAHFKNKAAMKKIIFYLLFIVLCGSSISASAQSYDTQADIQRELLPLINEVETLRDANDYRGALNADLEALAALSMFDDDFIRPLGIEKNLLYDIACFQALCGDTISAISSLQAASALGWHDYKHALNDTDLNALRDNRYFQAWLDKIKDYDFQVVLQNAEPYNNVIVDSLFFSYAPSNSEKLVELRTRLNLDSVAGEGDEISKIKNLTTFVHNFIKHNGSNGNPQPMNGLAFVDSCANNKGTLNCRGMAMLLNECLLSMGIPSRYITCYPKVMENDCHVINAVWSSQLNKWIWMDPSFNAWVTDEAGNLLGLNEVRAKLIANEPLVVNPEANHYDSTTDKEWYLDYYMTKNLYALEANSYNGFGAEDINLHPRSERTYIVLVPTGFKPNYTNATSVSNDDWFWQAPE